MSRHKQRVSAGRRTWERLGSAKLWSWGLFWFAASIYGLFTFLMDFLRTSNPSWLWFVTYSVSLAVAVGLGVLAKLAVRTFERPGLIAPLNVALAFVIGGVKNLTVALLALGLGLEKNTELLFRFFGGTFMGSMMIITFAAVSGARGEHARAVQRLKNIQGDLLGARDNLRLVLADDLEKLQDRSREAVLPKLQQIAQLLNNDSDNSEIIDELKATVNQKLRPLMNEISKSAGQSLTLKEDELAGKVRVSFPERLYLRDAMRPFTTAGYLFGSWVFITYYFLGVNGAMVGALAGVVYAFVLLVISKIFPQQSVKRLPAMFLLFCVSIVSQGPSLLIVGTLPLNEAQSISVPIILFCTGILAFSVFTYLFILDSERVKLEVKIAAENKELSKEVTVFEQKLWVFKRSWLFMLHGTVQSALTAALTRLQTFSDNDPYQSSLVRSDLERAEAALTSVPETQIDLNGAIDELKLAWQGVCAISVEIDMRAERALNVNKGTAYCVNEILKEAVGNAVRHGAATAVRAVLARIDDDVLELEIQNDGKAPAKKWKKGIGSRMLDDIALDWSLGNSGRLTTLRVRLPI